MNIIRMLLVGAAALPMCIFAQDNNDSIAAYISITTRNETLGTIQNRHEYRCDCKLQL